MTRRRSHVLVLLGTAAALVGVGIGVILAVNDHSAKRAAHSVATLKAALDRVPLPPGAKLVDETAQEKHGDSNTYVERQYRLTDRPPSSEQIHEALAGGGCRVVDPQSGAINSLRDTDWSALVLPNTGDLYVLPPGTKGGGVEVNWKADALYLSVKGGDVELT